MKRNTKPTPEQTLVNAAIKWYQFDYCENDDGTFLKAVRHFRSIEQQRARRYGNEWCSTGITNYGKLTGEEENVLDCCCDWYKANRNGSILTVGKVTSHLTKSIERLIAHQKKVKQDAIVGNYIFDKRDGMEDMVRWFGKMARRGAKYFMSCYYGCDCYEFILASRSPITKRDVQRECNHMWDEELHK